jgi:hypothetical protein
MVGDEGTNGANDVADKEDLGVTDEHQSSPPPSSPPPQCDDDEEQDQEETTAAAQEAGVASDGFTTHTRLLLSQLRHVAGGRRGSGPCVMSAAHDVLPAVIASGTGSHQQGARARVCAARAFVDMLVLQVRVCVRLFPCVG